MRRENDLNDGSKGFCDGWTDRRCDGWNGGDSDGGYGGVRDDGQRGGVQTAEFERVQPDGSLYARDQEVRSGAGHGVDHGEGRGGGVRARIRHRQPHHPLGHDARHGVLFGRHNADVYGDAAGKNPQRQQKVSGRFINLIFVEKY